MVQPVSDAGWAPQVLTLLPRGSHGFLFGSLLSVADECSSVRGQWTVVARPERLPVPGPELCTARHWLSFPQAPPALTFFFTNEGTRTIVTVFPATGWQSQDQTSPSVQSPHCLCLDAGRGLSSRLLQGLPCPWRPAICSRLCPESGLMLVKVTCVLGSCLVLIWDSGTHGGPEAFRDTLPPHCGLKIFY